MAKIVKVDIRQASSSQRREPHPAAEVGVPQRAPAWARKQQAVNVRTGKSRKVPGKIGHDEIRKHNSPLPGGLRRPEGVSAARCLGQLPKDAHAARFQVDIAAAERSQLSPPEAAENREKNQCTVPGVDRLSHGEHLAEGEHRPLRRSLLPSALRRHGLRRISPSSVAVFITARSSR
jgi:hypothetical protein